MRYLIICILCALCGACNQSTTDMKELYVKKISLKGVSVEAVPALLDAEGIAFVPIETVNWKEYSYRPETFFRIAHTGDAIVLHYKVREASVRAVAAADNGPVWEDACVEFFSSPTNDGIYYNMECNCTGTLLVGTGSSRNGREPASQTILDNVQRWASLGRAPFEERIGECTWEVVLIIPAATYFKHQVKSLSGKTMRANFYKCGDKLQTPHFLSWNPIAVEAPDFHRPEFFGTLRFE